MKTTKFATAGLFALLSIAVICALAQTRLEIRNLGTNRIELSWTNSGVILQAAPLAGGPYIDASQELVSPSVIGATNPAVFFRLVSAPVLLNVQPSLASAGAGNMIYITGQHLRSGDFLRIGGVLVTNLQYLGSTRWSATAPALGIGVFDVEIISGQSSLVVAKLEGAYEVVAGQPLQLLEPPEPAPGEPSSMACGATANMERVYTGSGTFKYSMTDLRIPGRGLDFKWCRTYRSRGGLNTTMGNGWTHSYDIRVQTNGTNVVIQDGTGRADTFYLQPDGSYARNEFFRIGTWSNNVFTLTFADNGTWQFNPLDGGPAAGKISRIVDRNHNELRCEYNGLGRLIRVVDSLGRTNTIAYNAAGLIASVTDFSGRQVKYEYYGGGDPNGPSGALRVAISPAVTGTPNGNDFPGGKTNRYSYSTGFADPRANNNLLTATDPKGQTWLQNTYTTNQNPTDVNFDRVKTQVRGNPSDASEYVYVLQTPSLSNGFATMKTIIRDPVGNVSEHYLDARNREVRELAYTGRAATNQPTTEVLNHPANPLRASDPAYFATRREYNSDSKVTKITEPNSNFTEHVYERSLNPTASRRSFGNLRETRRYPSPLGGDQSMLLELFEYGDTFCGACGYNFVTRHVDARGNSTYHAYDDRGNRTNTIHQIPTITEQYKYNQYGQMTAHVLPDNGSGYRRRDEYTYYTSGSQRGYPRTKVIDAGGLALTTTYEHNSVGVETRVTDARGNDSQKIVNALDQVVQDISREVVPGGGLRYQKDRLFDANDNLIRIEMENRDETGTLQSNNQFTGTWNYDILNREIRETQEVDETKSISVERQYDANGDLTLLRKGEAVSGNQPLNVIRYLQDERRLVYRQTEAEGDAQQCTTQWDYDANGNRRYVRRGLEGNTRVSEWTYDGYDRVIRFTDPTGNITTTHYDPAGNATTNRIDGELDDLPGSGGNVRLFEVQFTHDAMNRLTRRDVQHFNLATQQPVGDGVSRTETTYTDNGQIRTVTDDSNDSETRTYDSANRLKAVVDPLGNTVTNNYDANGNVTLTTRVSKSDLGNTNRIFTTTRAYDGNDRLASLTDDLGQTWNFSYDSRDNRVKETDPRGNVTKHRIDGAHRTVRNDRILTDDGTGTGNLVGTITTRRQYDDSGRLVAEIDDATNTTAYAYDARGRIVQATYADGTVVTQAWDIVGGPIRRFDANSSLVTNTYDLKGRITQRVIVPGAGVANDTTLETFRYDGLSRLVRAEDDDSLVQREWDSLSNLSREILDGRTNTAAYDGEGNLVSLTYPGGRIVTHTFDALNRVKTVSGPGLIAEYSYLGPKRLERLRYPRSPASNTVDVAYQYDAVGRMIHITSRRDPAGLGVILDERAFTWDAADNKGSRVGLLSGAGGWSHVYSYDSANRLTRSVRTRPAQPPEQTDYSLNDINNRVSVTGGPDPGSYTMDPALPVPADRPMNQYTLTPFDSRTYDFNGNLLTTAGSHQFQYDYANRLVRDVASGTGVITTFKYDALGRRISKTVDDGTPETTKYSMSLDSFRGKRSATIEEQSGAGTTLATYAYGNGSHELLQMRRGVNEFFYHRDGQDNVMALSGAAGRIVERFEYEDYGKPVFFGPAVADNPYYFQGQRYDTETSLVAFPSRQYDARIGRFISRDPIGMWEDQYNHGNGLAFVGNNPWSRTDPTGTVTCDDGRTVDLHFNDCDGLKKDWVKDHICDVWHGAKAAHDDVHDKRYDRDSGVYDALTKWFGNDSYISNSQWDQIKDVMWDVKRALRDETIKFECESSGGGCKTSAAGTASAYRPHLTKTFHLCPYFFNTDANPVETVYHELTHAYAGTDDEGYVTGIVEGVAQYQDKKGRPNDLNEGDKINNADTYSKLLGGLYGYDCFYGSCFPLATHTTK